MKTLKEIQELYLKKEYVSYIRELKNNLDLIDNRILKNRILNKFATYSYSLNDIIKTYLDVRIYLNGFRKFED